MGPNAPHTYRWHSWRSDVWYGFTRTREACRYLTYSSLLGTPAQIARPPDDPAILTADDGRQRRKSTPGDQSMRRTIQDLVASVDPNVKIDPEVEDVSSFFFFRVATCSNSGVALIEHRG